MKTVTYITILALLLTTCSKSDDNQNRNPNIPDFQFDTGDLINTNLPQYSQLLFPGNHIIVNANGVGVNGIVLYSSGSTYSAFELSDPNHQLNTCSQLTVESAIATCNCDDGNSYNIINGGQFEGTTGQYGLVPYGVEVIGNIIRVFNN